jgi:hypothetical protein
MPTQTIESPGVQINEVDLSLRAVVPNGTNVLVLGYANQGPIEEVLEIPDIQTFTTIYGTPTNAAERYFYYSVRGVLNGGGRPIVSRLPYGSGTGVGSTSAKYSCLAYPAVPFAQTCFAFNLSSTATFSTEQSGYFVGAPEYLQLTEDQYLSILQGNINWIDSSTVSQFVRTSAGEFSTFANLASAGFLVLNKFQSTFDNKSLEGYTIGIADSLDTDPQSDFNSVTSIKYSPLNETHTNYGEYLTIPSSRLNFVLESGATSNIPSVSRQIEQQDPNINLFQGAFIDSISLRIAKLRQSIYTPQAVTLDYTFPDGFLGSFNSRRQVQSQNGGQPVNFFVGDVEDSSTYISIIVNPNISTVSGDWTNAAGKPSKFVLFNHSTSGTVAKTEQVKNNAAFANTPLFGNGLSAWVTPASGSLYANIEAYLNAFLFPVDALYSYCPTILNSTVNGATTFAIGNAPAKIDRVFQTIDDVDALRIDLSVEAGLGTMYSICNTLSSPSAQLQAFDDTVVVDIGATVSGQTSTGFYRTNGNLDADTLSATVPGVGSAPFTYKAQDLKNNYLAVYEVFRTFAQDVRKDHLFIADALRPIFITGARTKVLSNRNNTFTQHINTPLRNQFDTTSTSYATVYGNWALVNDLTSGDNVWIPVSGLIAGMMAKDDANYAPWFAPAGFTRGKFPTPVLDIAVSPSQRNRDLLYKQGINPITKFPNDGITVFGQKTKLSTPSAFDRINVRRLFLYLEKVTRTTLKYFVFEPNTLFTRTNVVNVLNPIFENVKNNQGMYDYLIVCDARNNTPTVIDNNQLVVDIYIKPTRSAEFILVNFYATRTDQNFNELV